ncbi:hypothetical protein MOQ_007328 [Trypanosoma cruzi marinkellei]|uniref:Uncharacterized protein n=1 Tax=Trypanosoma cruzi marinkellei TaxID=85056 RepID=K2N2U7_TRYCR|nr:hypothetical protein MOQ_007328 [Trypanosoma cruzi marinkellei]
MAGACWCGKGSVPGVDLAVVASEWQRGATPAHSSTGLHAPRGLQATPVLVAPSLPHRDDRPATASAGTFPRSDRRKSLSTSGRRVDVLLPSLQRSALVRPQYDGTCPTCSAWRSDTWRRPRTRTPQWRHRLPNTRLACRSPSTAPSVPADKTRGKHKRVCQRSARLFRHHPITDVTCRGSHGGPRETPFHPLLECPSFGIVTVTVWECPSPHDARLRRKTCLVINDGVWATHR